MLVCLLWQLGFYKDILYLLTTQSLHGMVWYGLAWYGMEWSGNCLFDTYKET